MGLESVIEDIQRKGERERDAISAASAAEERQIQDEAQQRVDARRKEADGEISRVIQRTEDLELASANLGVKRALLNAQKEVLDQVYATALHAILGLPEQVHRQILEKLLQQAAQEIRTGVVTCRAQDVKVVKDLIAASPALSEYRIGPPVEIDGGVVVDSADGNVKIDLTYRTFLDGIWEKELKAASDLLFT
ncbi:MAG: V-type ATP synthase subunit E [Methanomicrobiales archaeon]|nr:V-type ATP synthase subunit E [Methanomicrobiales archaeon]